MVESLEDIDIELDEQLLKDELKVVVCGPVDAGKSSLIGVLNNGVLDDGRGSSRNTVLKHHHEISSGRTSNISVNVYEYKNVDNKLNLLKNNKVVKVMSKDLKVRDRVINLIDLAGHEKYLKTTVYGMLAYYPNYGIVVIGANTGITKLTKEHLGIMLYLNIPFSIVVTKVDITPKNVYLNLMRKLTKLLKGIKKNLYFVNKNSGDNDMKKYIDGLEGDSKKENKNNVIPIITISNKTGINIENLHYMLNNVKIKKKDKKLNYVNIDAKYNVLGIGLVVCGTSFGRFELKKKYYIGPYNGKFYQITIRSIHNCLRENVNNSEDNKYYSYAIKFTNQKETLEKKYIKKGMIILEDLDNSSKFTSRKFRAKIKILHHSTMIRNGYSPLIHIGGIRQSASINVLDNKNMRTGETAIVEFRFLYRPEFVLEGETIFFRDGLTKGVGEVLSVIKE